MKTKFAFALVILLSLQGTAFAMMLNFSVIPRIFFPEIQSPSPGRDLESLRKAKAERLKQISESIMRDYFAARAVSRSS